MPSCAWTTWCNAGDRAGPTSRSAHSSRRSSSSKRALERLSGARAGDRRARREDGARRTRAPLTDASSSHCTSSTATRRGRLVASLASRSGRDADARAGRGAGPHRRRGPTRARAPTAGPRQAAQAHPPEPGREDRRAREARARSRSLPAAAWSTQSPGSPPRRRRPPERRLPHARLALEDEHATAPSVIPATNSWRAPSSASRPTTDSGHGRRSYACVILPSWRSRSSTRRSSTGSRATTAAAAPSPGCPTR